MNNKLNSNSHSGIISQKDNYHNTLISPSHPSNGVRGFFIFTQKIQSCPDPTTINDCKDCELKGLAVCENYQEGLNLVRPLEPDLSGINETVRERVSATTPSKYKWLSRVEYPTTCLF